MLQRTPWRLGVDDAEERRRASTSWLRAVFLHRIGVFLFWSGDLKMILREGPSFLAWDG